MFQSEIDVIPGSGLLAMSHKILLSLVQACEKIEIKGKVETLVQSRGQGQSVSGFLWILSHCWSWWCKFDRTSHRTFHLYPLLR